MSVNERVKEIRMFLGVSQSDFAKRIHLSSGYISSLERGDRKVNLRIIKLICDAYSISEVWLRSGEGQMYDNTAEARVEKAMKLFKKLSPDNQELFLQLIKTIRKMQNEQSDTSR